MVHVKNTGWVVIGGYRVKQLLGIPVFPSAEPGMESHCYSPCRLLLVHSLGGSGGQLSTPRDRPEMALLAHGFSET